MIDGATNVIEYLLNWYLIQGKFNENDRSIDFVNELLTSRGLQRGRQQPTIPTVPRDKRKLFAM